MNKMVHSHHTLQISFFRTLRLHLSVQVLNWSSSQHTYTNQLIKTIKYTVPTFHEAKLRYVKSHASQG